MAGTEDDDLRLSLSSPCVDVADNSAIALCAVDLDGHSRRTDDPATPDGGLGDAPIADMGAYELGGMLADCNANAIDDTCEIADGSSKDSDNDGVLDECEESTDSPADQGGCDRDQGCTGSIDCDDDDSCTQDTCQGGACVNAVIVCDDDLFCNGVEICDEGQCIPGQDRCPQNQICNEEEDVCDIMLCGALGDGVLATALTVALGFSLLGLRRRGC